MSDKSVTRRIFASPTFWLAYFAYTIGTLVGLHQSASALWWASAPVGLIIATGTYAIECRYLPR